MSLRAGHSQTIDEFWVNLQIEENLIQGCIPFLLPETLETQDDVWKEISQSESEVALVDIDIVIPFSSYLLREKYPGLVSKCISLYLENDKISSPDIRDYTLMISPF